MDPAAHSGDLDVAALLASHANDGRISIIGPSGAITYEALAERVSAVAAAVMASGLRLENPVGVAIKEEVDHLVATLALLALGIPSVVLPSHEGGPTIAEIAVKVGVTQYVGDERRDLPENLLARPIAGGAGRAAAVQTRRMRASETALFRTTSGTTGIPKVFALSGERLGMMARNAAADPSQHRVLRTSSVEYDSSRLSRVAALLAGNTCIFAAELSGDTLHRLCATADVTEIQIGTYKLAGIMAGVVRRLSEATSIQTGGSRVPGPLRDAVQKRMCRNLFVSYATSEIGIISMATPDQHAAFPEGVGDLVDGVTLEIVDAAGRPVEPGTVGEARVRKAGAPQLYLKDAAASAALSGGWFRTRDLVSQRPAEPLIFHGRSDDMMILNGINIFGAAIEDTLEAIPQVAEAVAYPIRSNVHGEIPVAAVVLKPNAGSISSSELIRLCRERLGFGSPRQVFIVDQIPRTALGKPLRLELPGRV